ncbi:hypothetical protein LINPERHAP1_LOCUS33611 [Linum perenne]
MALSLFRYSFWIATSIRLSAVFGSLFVAPYVDDTLWYVI